MSLVAGKTAELDRKTRRMVKMALAMRDRAYARYSHYRVGCVVEDTRGRVYSGCNVENSSYSVTVCAERAALARMVAGGGVDCVRVVLATYNSEPCLPCGLCRQAIAELGSQAEVIAVSSDGENFVRVSIGELLPYTYTHLILEEGMR